jgi:hypothetical protein
MPNETRTAAAMAAATARREFLRTGALALGAGAVLPCGAAAPQPAAVRGGAWLTYEQFLAEAVPLARQLASDATRPGEDRYLLALAALAVRLQTVVVPKLRRVNAADQPAHWIGANDAPDDCPFTVLHWQLAPHAIVRPHPHTYGSVVTLGLEGEVRILNHETVEAPDYETAARFTLRRVHDQMLRPHDVNLVPLSHGFIHGFVAGPDGARGLDITTRVRDKQPNLSVEIGKALDADRALYEGRWLRA